MPRLNEYKLSESIVRPLRRMGWTVRKMEDRFGGYPDYQMARSDWNVAQHPSLPFEMKVIDQPPPWSPRELTLRRNQAQFFRTWPARSAVVAALVPKGRGKGDVRWAIGLHPTQHYHGILDDPDEVAVVLADFAAGVLPARLLPEQGQGWLL